MLGPSANGLHIHTTADGALQLKIHRKVQAFLDDTPLAFDGSGRWSDPHVLHRIAGPAELRLQTRHQRVSVWLQVSPDKLTGPQVLRMVDDLDRALQTDPIDLAEAIGKLQGAAHHLDPDTLTSQDRRALAWMHRRLGIRLDAHTRQEQHTRVRKAQLAHAMDQASGPVPRGDDGSALASLQGRLTRVARKLDLGRPRQGDGWRLSLAGRRKPHLARLSALAEALASPPPADTRLWEPIGHLDQLYESWAQLCLVRAFQTATGTARQTPPTTQQTACRFASGHAIEAEQGELSCRLLLEPTYDARPDGRIGKLIGGRPWRPDAALEVRRGGWLVGLHLFDAKHRRDATRPHDDHLPLDVQSELTQRYGDTIGDVHTGVPLVSSVWMLYPGSTNRLKPRVPSMLSGDWPVDRLRHGAVSLAPDGAPEEPLVSLFTVLVNSHRASSS